MDNILISKLKELSTQLKGRPKQSVAALSIGIIALYKYNAYKSKKKRKKDNDEHKEEKKKKTKRSIRFEKNIDKNKERVKKGGRVNKLFFKQLKKLLRIMIPNNHSKEMSLLVIQAIFLFLRTFMSIQVARLDGYIVKSLVSARKDWFFKGLFYWILISLPATSINSMIRYLQNCISIRFRTRLTKYLHKEYLSNRIYYKVLNLDSRIENADQLITQDVSKFCKSVSELYSNLAKPILDIVLFGSQLSGALGAGGPAGIGIFYIVTGFILKLVTPAFGKMAAKEGKLEGEFRAAHSRLITNAEEIAFYDGAHVESDILEWKYDDLKRHMYSIFRKRIPHGIMEGMIVKYLSSAAGLLICGIPVFWPNTIFAVGGKKSEGSSIGRAGEYTRNRRYLLNLADAIGRVLFSYKEITELSGYTDRVHTLLEVFDDVKQGKYVKTVSKSNEQLLKTFDGGKEIESKDHIKFDNVPIVSPNGDVLVKDLSFQIKSGENLMIVGPNGCGKSSLFRILGGLWPAMNGFCEKPNNSQISYIPQRAYLCLGTFRDQIIYPDREEDMKEKGYTDQDLLDILEITHLTYILDREGGWDAVKDWKDVLSGGEKQRVGFSRLLFHKPKYAILDECTSQVSFDVEGSMYTHAKDIGITLLTVSHRSTLWKYHDKVLRFDGQGGWAFTTMEKNEVVQNLSQEKASLEKVLREIPKTKARIEEITEIMRIEQKA